jgi:hypothetical protein
MLRCGIGLRAGGGNHWLARWTPARFGASLCPNREVAMGRFAALCLAVALTACKPAAPTLDPQAEGIARTFYDEVRSGADLNADTHLAHELKNPTSEQQLQLFRAMIPIEPPRSVEMRSFDVKTDSTGTTTRLTEVYHYADRTVVAQTALFKSPSGTDPVIVGFQVSNEAAE